MQANKIATFHRTEEIHEAIFTEYFTFIYPSLHFQYSQLAERSCSLFPSSPIFVCFFFFVFGQSSDFPTSNVLVYSIIFLLKVSTMKHISKYINTISDLLCHQSSFLCYAQIKKFLITKLYFTQQVYNGIFFKKCSLAVVTYLLIRLHEAHSFLLDTQNAGKNYSKD